MKNLFAVFIFLLLALNSFGQKAIPFDEAGKIGLRTGYLDSLYSSGIHSDSTLAVFKSDKEEEYISAYQNLLKDLGSYLKKNSFNWDKATKGFNRIYFHKDGTIDYFVYSFRAGQISPEQEKEFQKLLTEFIQNYKFPLTADKPFAQCSPVTYMPWEK